MEQTLQSTSTSEGNQESLIDFHEDLKNDLPVMDSYALKRQDTDTQSLDEFVDAEG
jgi:hypothetical protein